MSSPYSANEKVDWLATNLGFQCRIFDDPGKLAPQIKLREGSKDAEVDAVLCFKNLITLVGINRGKSEHAQRELKKFADGLDKATDVASLKLELKISGRDKTKIATAISEGNKMLDEVKLHIKTVTSTFDPILVKLFCCPSVEIDAEEHDNYRKKGVLILDKDVQEYFEAVLARIDKHFLLNEFMHYVGLRKTDFTARGTSKLKQPGQTSPYEANRLELTKDKINMYFLSMQVDDIIDFVTVLRISQKYDRRGFQRMVKPARLTSINRKYLSANETFPNSIIMALDPAIYTIEDAFYKQTKSGNELRLFDEYNSLILIDGQHRFFSFVKGGKTDRRFLATLIFFKGDDLNSKYELMDKMFYNINKTQERIDPNLSFILKARIDPESEDAFWYPVFRKLDQRGFFAKRFSFKETVMRGQSEKSIISVVKYGGVLALNKRTKRGDIEVNGLTSIYPTGRDSQIDFAFNLLKNYFDILEKVLHDQKVDKNNLTPREIGATIRLLKHFMLADSEKVKNLGSVVDITKSRLAAETETREYFEEFLCLIRYEDAMALTYPASNWAAVEGYMLKKIHATKPDFGNVALLSEKGQDVYKITA